MEPIKLAIEAVGGRQIDLAKAISVKPQVLYQWVHGERPVPAKHCIPIETATGGKVTRYDLRPDVFGEAPASPKRKPKAA